MTFQELVTQAPIRTMITNSYETLKLFVTDIVELPLVNAVATKLDIALKTIYPFELRNSDFEQNKALLEHIIDERLPNLLVSLIPLANALKNAYMDPSNLGDTFTQEAQAQSKQQNNTNGWAQSNQDSPFDNTQSTSTSNSKTKTTDKIRYLKFFSQLTFEFSQEILQEIKNILLRTLY